MKERQDKPVVSVESKRVDAAALEPVAPELAPEAIEFASRSRAENTKRAYEAQWSRFEAWCRAKGLTARPADRRTVANYLTYLASFGKEPELDSALKRKKPLKAASIRQAKAVISKAHTDAGFPNPTEAREVSDVMEGICRTLGEAVDKRAPLSPKQLEAMLELAPDSLLGARDRAILLLGWAGAFRRSELVALDVEDLFRGDEPGSLVALVGRSKTDQLGHGKKKPIHPSAKPELCPVRAIAAWLKASGITTGPLFRPATPDGRTLIARRLSDDMVYETVLWYVERAGLDPGVFAGFGAHSLRAGFCTTAAIKGKDLHEIMKVSGHAKVDTLLGYIRDAELFSDKAAGRGLLDS